VTRGLSPPRDHATVGKHDDDPAGREEKETYIAYVVKANGHSTALELPHSHWDLNKSQTIQIAIQGRTALVEDSFCRNAERATRFYQIALSSNR
jgi:hypothetical protein